MYAGVDEAGRGPVLGPLVVAGVLGDPTDLPAGIRDSKQLSPRHRETLYEQLRSAPLKIHVVTLEADELSERMEAGESLNEIELAAFRDVLGTLAPRYAVVDALGRDTAGLGAHLTQALGGSCTVQARIGADASDPMVSAASILAKVTRDRALRALSDALGRPIGSGYPSDPETRAFLSAWRTEHGRPPPGARRTWATLTELGYGNRSLEEFADLPGGSP